MHGTHGQKTLNSVAFESGEQPSVVLNAKKLDAFMVGTRGRLITLGDDEPLSEVEHVMGSHQSHDKGSGSPWCRFAMTPKK